MKYKNIYIKKNLLVIALINITILLSFLVLAFLYFMPSKSSVIEKKYDKLFDQKIICSKENSESELMSKTLSTKVNIISCSDISNKEILVVISPDNKNVKSIINKISPHYSLDSSFEKDNSLFIFKNESKDNITKLKKEL